MQKIYSEYKEVKDKTIMITLSYMKEGNRGYYVSIVPVKLEEKNGYVTRTVEAYSGVKKHLLAVTRKSAKAEKEAIRILEECEDRLISYVVGKNAA